ncbi:MFS transporter [candidate division KSB1 bacterium]|nr:MFS transporter [candidate division KSB1 bacterium]
MNLFRFFAASSPQTPLTNEVEIDRLYRRKRLSLMMSITLGYAFYYTCRLGLSIVKKPLIDGGIFSANDLGVIGSAIFYGYAFGKLINGFLADHANIKRFFAFGLLLSAAINIIMGGVHLLWIWVLLWGLNGWFQGFGAPGSIVTLSQWFSNRERGRYYGIWNSAHSIGEGLTFVATAALVTWLGWTSGFWAPGVVCVGVAFLLFRTMEDRPSSLGLPPVAEWNRDFSAKIIVEAQDTSSLLRKQLAILLKPPIWILGLSSALMYVTRYAINSWGILYLQESKGYSLLGAGGILGLNTAAGILGCIVFGFASDKFFKARRPPVNLIYAVFEVAALTVIFFSPWGHPLVLSAAFVVYGFTLSGLMASLGGLFAIDITPKSVSGAALGFIGIFSYIGAALQERISGYWIDRGTTFIDGVRHYDFHIPILFWFSASILSALLAALLWRVKSVD